jgi:hypothetical protein
LFEWNRRKLDGGIGDFTIILNCGVDGHSFVDVLDGYNGTVFAYGQTGSGKTFTMMVLYFYKFLGP